MSGRKLTDEEKRIWEAAARHVRRFEHAETPEPVMVKSVQRQTDVASTSKTVAKDASNGPSPRPPNKAARPSKPQPSKVQNRQNERRVRRGKQTITASFDLHGFNQEDAWRALPQFLAREQRRGSRCVIIITGKGRYGEGVLRRNFLHWIETKEARHLISGYAPAHQRHGGGGAWYVYLRKTET